MYHMYECRTLCRQVFKVDAAGCFGSTGGRFKCHGGMAGKEEVAEEKEEFLEISIFKNNMI